jgi:hypothetical protein
MRAFFISAALMSAALSGCITCRIPLNAPPYDPTQWGWGPQERFYVTRSYYGFAKDYPGVHPYRMVPPGSSPYLNSAQPPDFGPGPAPCAACGPNGTPYGPNGMPMWPAQAPLAGPTMAMNPTAVAF